jgi:hypothetical protein
MRPPREAEPFSGRDPDKVATAAPAAPVVTITDRCVASRRTPS